MPCLYRLLLASVLFALGGWASANESVPAPGQPASQQAELAKLRDYVTDVGARLVQLQQALIDAEQRNLRQSQLIGQLESKLAAEQQRGERYQRRIQHAFFTDLAASLPLSPMYRVMGDRLVIQADPVFVFGTGEIGAEGETRLAGVSKALLALMEELPGNRPWRLRVAGHTDSRPVRDNARFPSNWELSAARALSVVRLLRRSGLASERLYAVAFAATRPRVAGDDKSAHRQNRRIEITLELVN